jgi:hypothetical protein
MTSDHDVQSHLFGLLFPFPFRQNCAEILSTLPHFTLTNAATPASFVPPLKPSNGKFAYIKTNPPLDVTGHFGGSGGQVADVF